MKASEIRLDVGMADWFQPFVDAQAKAAIEAVEKGAPIEFVKDQFESAVRSAAFDAVVVGGKNDSSK